MGRLARLAPALVAASLGFLLEGCGAFSLIHDAYIGPISPAGYIHPYVTGENFVVDETGIHVDTGDDALLRPFPRDFLDRGASFVPAVRGIEFGVAGFSVFVVKDARTSAPVDPDRASVLRKGMSVQEVLALLGAPRVWIKREQASLMIYSAEIGFDWDLHIGVPPGVSDLIPIPGVASITFARSSKERAPKKTMLFFDRQDALVSVVGNERPQE